jgi:hypothetical protein
MGLDITIYKVREEDFYDTYSKRFINCIVAGDEEFNLRRNYRRNS